MHANAIDGPIPTSGQKSKLQQSAVVMEDQQPSYKSAAGQEEFQGS